MKARCRYCYRLFVAERSTAAFCSDTCRQAAHREKSELDDRTHFLLVLRAEKRVKDPIKSLRALLKVAGRQYGLKATQIREQTPADDEP